MKFMSLEEFNLEHQAIVDSLRRRGWDRIDANEEADILMNERLRKRGVELSLSEKEN